MGKLIFNYGSMNSGKSLQLLAFAAKLRNQGIPYDVAKPSEDTRDAGVISSRPLNEKLPCILLHKNSGFLHSFFTKKGTKYLLIDEAQFLDPALVDHLGFLANDLDLTIICYGLRTDFQTHLFPGSKRLFEIADELHDVDELNIDANGDKIIFNARLVNDKIVTTGPQVEVGAEDKYLAMSRKEYYRRLYEQVNE